MRCRDCKALFIDDGKLLCLLLKTPVPDGENCKKTAEDVDEDLLAIREEDYARQTGMSKLALVEGERAIFPKPEPIVISEQFVMDELRTQHIKGNAQFSVKGMEDEVERLSCKIDEHKRSAGLHFLMIGKILKELSTHLDFKLSVWGDFEKFCSGRFDFGRSTVHNYIGVYNTFGHRIQTDEVYRQYSYTQLVELLPIVNRKEFSEVDPSWSVSRIRDLRREIKAREDATKKKKVKLSFRDRVKKVFTQEDFTKVRDIAINQGFAVRRPYQLDKKIKANVGFFIEFYVHVGKEPMANISTNYKTGGSSSRTMTISEFLAFSYDSLIDFIVNKYPSEITGEVKPVIFSFENDAEITNFLENFEEWPLVGRVDGLGMSFYKCYLSDGRVIVAQQIIESSGENAVYYQWIHAKTKDYIPSNFDLEYWFDAIKSQNLKACYEPIPVDIQEAKKAS